MSYENHSPAYKICYYVPQASCIAWLLKYSTIVVALARQALVAPMLDTARTTSLCADAICTSTL
jgi:hypothetical protein